MSNKIKYEGYELKPVISAQTSETHWVGYPENLTDPFLHASKITVLTNLITAVRERAIDDNVEGWNNYFKELGLVNAQAKEDS